MARIHEKLGHRLEKEEEILPLQWSVYDWLSNRLRTQPPGSSIQGGPRWRVRQLEAGTVYSCIKAKESFVDETADELGNAVTCADRTLRKAAQVLSQIVERIF